MRTYKGIKVYHDEEFEKEFGGNWMITNEKGEYNKVAREKLIIEECKDTKGKRSTTPYVACDNSEGCCFMEAYATIEEAYQYLMEGEK